MEGEAMPSFDEWRQKEQEKSKTADGRPTLIRQF